VARRRKWCRHRGIQLFHAAGASAVFATVRQGFKGTSLEKELKAKKAGNSEGEWPEEILKLTDGEGVNVIVDFIGGPALM
jgi:NADPH:quinone reductase-like Zn-dependent oxidoreductase